MVVFNTILDDMLIHFTSYGANHVRLSINIVFVPDALLPCPINDYMYVGQYDNVPLPWPARLVLSYTKIYINFTMFLAMYELLTI